MPSVIELKKDNGVPEGFRLKCDNATTLSADYLLSQRRLLNMRHHSHPNWTAFLLSQQQRMNTERLERQLEQTNKLLAQSNAPNCKQCSEKMQLSSMDKFSLLYRCNRCSLVLHYPSGNISYEAPFCPNCGIKTKYRYLQGSHKKNLSFVVCERCNIYYDRHPYDAKINKWASLSSSMKLEVKIQQKYEQKLSEETDSSSYSLLLDFIALGGLLIALIAPFVPIYIMLHSSTEDTLFPYNLIPIYLLGGFFFCFIGIVIYLRFGDMSAQISSEIKFQKTKANRELILKSLSEVRQEAKYNQTEGNRYNDKAQAELIPSDEVAYCRGCARKIEISISRCPYCHEIQNIKKPATCPNCSKTMNWEWEVCPYCGQRIA